MATLHDAAAALRDAFDKKQAAQKAWPAYAGDGAGTVRSTDRFHIYARYSPSSPTFEVYNTVAPEIDNLRIMVGYRPESPGLLQVLSFMYDTRINSSAGLSLVPNHAEQHQWLAPDPVQVNIRQWTPLRVIAYTGLLVYIEGGVLSRAGADVYVQPQLLDLEYSIPDTGGRYALIYLDDTGAAQVLDGSVQTNALALSITDVPATPAGGFRLAAVQLIAGQTEILEKGERLDILDLRWPQERTTAGTGGTPGGADRQIQINDAAAFGVVENFSIDAGGELTIPNNITSPADILIYVPNDNTSYIDLSTDNFSLGSDNQTGGELIMYNQSAGGGTYLLCGLTADDNGGSMFLTGRAGPSGNASGGAVNVLGGNAAGSGNGGDVNLTPGSSPSGVAGHVRILFGSWSADLETSNLTENRTFTFPDAAGTFALTSQLVTGGDSHDHTGGAGAAIPEAGLSLSNNTTGNASTSAHGFAPIATAPAAGLINVLGIANGETVYTNKALFDATNPATLTVSSTSTPGSATVTARGDHSHAITSSSNPGAAASLLATDASGNLTIAGVLTGSNTTDSTSTSTGGIVTGGGLGVAKTAVIGGQLGVGTAPNAAIALDIARTTSGTNIYGVRSLNTIDNTTSNGIGVYGRIITAASSFTLNTAAALYAANPTKGAGSTITTAVGLKVENITAGATNYAIHTLGGGLKFDGVAVANGTVATAMTNLGPAGSHTTIQKWLAIDLDGAVGYIPVF